MRKKFIATTLALSLVALSACGTKTTTETTTEAVEETVSGNDAESISDNSTDYEVGGVQPTYEFVESDEEFTYDPNVDTDWWFTTFVLNNHIFYQFDYTQQMFVQSDNETYVTLLMYTDEEEEHANWINVYDFDATDLTLADLDEEYNDATYTAEYERSEESSTLAGHDCTLITYAITYDDDDVEISEQYWIPYESDGQSRYVVVDYTLQSPVADAYGDQADEILENCQYVLDNIIIEGF
jgi:hypothetical protein